MTTWTRWFQTKRSAAAAMAAVGLLPFMASCTTTRTTDGTASSFLIINELTAAAGTAPTQFSSVLSSDVVTLVKVTDPSGATLLVPTVFEDAGEVSLSLGLRDPGTSDSPTKPTSANFITVTRYHVEFVRADGRNTPGVDVPFPFDGGMSVTVGGSNATGGFALVRLQAKEEAPLRALREGGSALVISTIAKVTFFGTDQTGRPVSVTGNISVNFADWADPK